MEGVNLTIILVPLLILFSSMDFKHKIIQWNCRGLKPNFNEVSLLISEYNPSVFCFQETFLKPDDNISLRGFNIYNYVHTDCLRPSGGASVFVKSSFPQRKIDLQTELQATAISVTLDKEITICSVYIPPSFSLNSQHLDSLLQQLPSPYIILGDFNGHNILWGGKNNDSRGELIENFLTKNDICIMNDKSYTYLSTSAKSFSSIDLSFCHPSLFLDYNWSVSKDQHNSDHFPIIIEQNTFSTEDHNPKWKLNRANWDLFNTLCTGKLIPENFKESSDPISDFTSSLIEISKECIPQTSTNPTKSNPWYNDDCKEAIKQRKQALSKFINRYILNKWQILWNNSVGNKLFEIKPVIGQSQPVVRNVRQEEVVLARLRIGHTRITHSYLLKREEPPYCFGCDTLFTVRHFLLECGDFSHIRNKYFHVDTIKQLFNDVPIDNVFLFLKEINLFNKL